MAEQRVQRRLAAIVAADVVGYSRLMNADEAGTLRELNVVRTTLMEPIVAEYRGRIVKLMGDGLLIEFASAVDAVESMIHVQRRVAERNAEVPDSRSIVFRIGVNLGDVIVEADDIFGDGVNVAARLEKLADPGGICISGIVFDQVRGKLDAGFEHLGTHQVKNVAEPIRTYRVAAASVVNLTAGHIPVATKPSIVVLPFDNMSDDHAQEYFSDGISEDLTTALSRFNWLFVIARNSAFTYKGKAADLKKVRRELGVRYILEGSVRRAGDRVRVNAQLIDAESERHVWAQRYDRRLDDLFELQDDIVASIATVVGPEITLAEIERVRTKRSDDLNAWDHYLRAMAAYHRMTQQDMEAAIAGLEAAIRLDADFANAYALLAMCHTHVGMRGWIRPARTAFEEALRRAEQAVRLSPASPEANQSLAFVLAITGHAEQAVGAARRAIELNPNLAEAYATLGRALVFCGALQEGIAACLKAERGNPRDARGTWLYDGMSHGYFFLGEYDKAIEVAKKGYHQDPSMFGALVTLACAHARQGRAKEAKHFADELVRQMPRYSVQAVRKNPMFVDPKLIEELLDSLRLAGLPE